MTRCEYIDWQRRLWSRELPRRHPVSFRTVGAPVCIVTVVAEDWYDQLRATGYTRQPASAKEVRELESDRIYGRVSA